ncbi:hypothetical protein CRG98_029741 [Punica granatum]|uniref:CCHC-type domain-containing protein n=1 Tax=Punica granatum TaxID=22663 RepID=A0A2I0J0W7_PUNGR|nr:hypothetical protein CRG98_029741 [Punica granatum]
MSVTKYYSRLKTLWDELDNYLEIPACTCSAIRLYAAQREREKTHQFLMGLGSEFATVRSNILSHELAHPLNKVYALILHKERQNIVAQSHENAAPDGAVFLSKITAKQGSGNEQTYGGQGGGRGSGAASKTCIHCGRVGHIKSSCWLLHGYSANLESKPSSERGRRTGNSSASGRRGGGTGMDRTTRKTIGVGELQRGVYYLRRVAIRKQANRVISDEADDLWHM